MKEPISQRDWDDAHTIDRLLAFHEDDPEFGYRFLADELELNGFKTGERRVWRLCRQEQILSTTVKKGRKGKTWPGRAWRPGPAGLHSHSA